MFIRFGILSSILVFPLVASAQEDPVSHQEKEALRSQWFNALTSEGHNIFYRDRALTMISGGESVPTIQMEWNDVSPSALGGRVLSYAHNPDTGELEWVGSSSGGLWQLIDDRWIPMTDSLPALSISAIAINPHDPANILIGTGESSGYTPRILATGIYESRDRGHSWSLIKPIRQMLDNPDTTRAFGKDDLVTHHISFDPSPQDTFAYIVTNYGIIIHKAGPNAETSSPYPILRHNDDKAIEPISFVAPWQNDTSTGFYVATRKKLFRVIKKEQAWAPPPEKDLPVITNRLLAEFFTIEELDIPVERSFNLTSLSLHASAHQHILYASLSNHEQASSPEPLESQILKLSTSPDQSVALHDWKHMPGPPSPVSVMRVSPHDANLLFAGYVHGYRSEDGGASWNKLSTDPGHQPGDGNLHVDIKAYSFHPENADHIHVYTDGGVYESRDKGMTWIPINNGLTNLMVYSVAQSSVDSGRFAIGLQDQGVWEFKNDDWHSVATGDGVSLVYGKHKPVVDRVANEQEESLYAGMQTPYSTVNLTETSRLRQSQTAPTLWTPPMVRIGDKNAPLYLSATKESIVKTSEAILNATNWRALNWSVKNRQAKNISLFKEDPVNPSRILAYARQDTSNTAAFWESEDAGENWTLKSDFDLGLVSDIAFDPERSQRIYVTRTDTAQAVLFTEDDGNSWNSFTDPLFDTLKLPVSDLLIVAPTEEGGQNLFLIGTDIGIFVRTEESDWHFAGAGMPHAVITQMVYRVEDNTLLVGTFGRGVWAGKLPQALMQ